MLCGESPVAWAMCVRRFAAVFLLVCLWPAAAADLPQARKLFVSGDYSECIRLSEQALRDRERDEEWPMLLMKSLLATGRFPEAQSALTNALSRHRSSIRVLLLGCDVTTANGDTDRARALLDEINDRGGARRGVYRDPPNLGALGPAAPRIGAPPHLVLGNIF